MVGGNNYFLIRARAMSPGSRIDSACSFALYNRNPILDADIVKMIQKMAKELKCFFSDIDDREAFRVGSYAVYHELLKSTDQRFKTHIQKFNSFDRFISYYRDLDFSNNPFLKNL